MLKLNGRTDSSTEEFSTIMKKKESKYILNAGMGGSMGDTLKFKKIKQYRKKTISIDSFMENLAFTTKTEN